MWRQGDLLMEVKAPQATVVHQEHRPITLPGPAVYRVIQQREYSPESPIREGYRI
jgi:hypothetical protein